MNVRQGRTTRGKGRWIKGFGPRKGEDKRSSPADLRVKNKDGSKGEDRS